MIPDVAAHSRVLVAVVTRPKDFTCVREQHWYRIPVARAPRNVAASVLAFYQTAAFGEERWAVRYAALIQRVSIATRGDLLPDEPLHPRADTRYYRFELGPLWALPTPVPSRRLRRITFISTTWEQLISARDVVELWKPSESDDLEMWGAGVNARAY